MKVLVVEDEKVLNEAICDFLKTEKFTCDAALNHYDAEDLLLICSYDLVVVDINLPNSSGLDLIDWIKKGNIDSGILIISARDSLDDKLKGLDLGADDYLIKPFHLAELNARINAIIRRRRFDTQQTIEFNEFVLDPTAKEVTINDTRLDLTPKQYDILEFFITNKNKVISKESMAGYLWNGDALQAHNLEFIYNHVKNIRSIIKKAGGKDYIKTIYGLGYKFSA